jgi:histidine ammonia-lyase
MLAEGIEDRITMAPLAARRLSEQVAVSEELLALGLVIAAQAVDVRGCAPLGSGTARAQAQVRERYAFVAAGESIGPDRGEVVQLVRSGALGVES